ncbi:MAG TPA: RHS repeat-associated core domain-containing protein, partial [Vicinamibacterales bacterium]|nr:RHS repeat-associated core domain-containing protein [Vicinamibacterales bacterium]
VRMMTDANGQVIKRFDYLPFGELWPGDPPDRRQFAGKERDAETGFDYFGGRYYASQTGRFTTVDPVLEIEQALVDPQRWNRYTYVANRPLKFVDPDGRNPLLIIPILYGLYELGSTAYDVYTTYQTFRDPNATTTERAVTGGGLLLGAIAPGGGYATGGRALFRSSLELGHHIESVGLKIENILTKNLDAATIQAAVRELRGEVVAINPRTGAPFNHVDKVMQAARGLEKQADEIKRLLSSGDLTRKARSILESQLRRTRETLSELEAYGLVP